MTMTAHRGRDMHSADITPDRAPSTTQGPAVLRLLMLEATQAQRDRALSDESRDAARLLAARLRRAIAETPSLTFADVVAKLEIARGARPDAAAPLDADMLRSAIDDLRRLPATA
jgi:hypothetical protein